jgi:hypothetical protein
MKGGCSTTSSPLVLFAAGIGIGEGLGLGDSEGEGDGDGCSDGDGAALGVGVGGPCSVKVAHGVGVPGVAHIWWSPGAAPANGFALTPLKLPWPSVVVEPITFVGASQ